MTTSIEEFATNSEINRARKLYQTHYVEIDDEAKISRTDEGVWVAAWVWLENEKKEE
jgi:hypothetical protein